MNFKSDNAAGVCPEIMKALEVANIGFATSYGEDDYSKQLAKKVAEIFEHEVTIFLTSTGTAANCLSLSAIAPAYGTIYCHTNAHINTDECGAPELLIGAKLTVLGGAAGKINVQDLENQILFDADIRPHASKPAAISVTQLTEGGTVYSLQELQNIHACAQRHGLYVHMDGARCANALVSLGCTSAQMTWKSGIDVLSFGATKNGAMMAEMVVIFNQELAKDFDYRHKRAGQLLSKTRFEAAQFLAYFEHDLWLKNARHSNAMAQQLAAHMTAVPGVSIDHEIQGNELFVNMPSALADYLLQKGAHFYSWGPGVYRLVTSWATTAEEVAAFGKFVAGFKSASY
jgi:threonine aldolase